MCSQYKDILTMLQNEKNRRKARHFESEERKMLFKIKIRKIRREELIFVAVDKTRCILSCFVVLTIFGKKLTELDIWIILSVL